MQKVIIGLSGKMGSGKSTAALLIKHHFPQFVEASFADPVKRITSIVTNTPLELQYTQEGKRTYIESFGMTIREVQQKIGTECFRNNFHTDTWVICLIDSIKNLEYVIVSDVRFLNEVQAIKQNGGHIIRIVRSNETNDTHPSETQLDNHFDLFDYFIVNNGSIKSLEDSLIYTVKEILGQNGLVP